MTPFAFDTLNASKRLREAGMAEGVAEAVVSVFQHAAAMPDISHLATRVDVADMATKADIADMATKGDIEAVRTEVKMLGLEMQVSASDLRAELNDKLRQTVWMMLGGVTVLLTISTAMTRVLAG